MSTRILVKTFIHLFLFTTPNRTWWTNVWNDTNTCLVLCHTGLPDQSVDGSVRWRQIPRAGTRTILLYETFCRVPNSTPTQTVIVKDRWNRQIFLYCLSRRVWWRLECFRVSFGDTTEDFYLILVFRANILFSVPTPDPLLLRSLPCCSGTVRRLLFF